MARVDRAVATSSTRRGTTGKPKGVQRDTGGYAVALAASMQHIFCVAARRDHFTTSDIGWVVGHSYIVYGPLHRTASTTIMYEGLPIRPDAGIWWKIVAEAQGDGDVQLADRDPRAEEAGPGVPEAARPVERCAYLFLAGEPLDEPTARWIADALGVADHRQLLADRDRLADPVGAAGRRGHAAQVRQPVVPGLRLRRAAAATRRPATKSGADEKGVLAIAPPLPPGCMTTVWGDDERFVQHLLRDVPGQARLLDLRLGASATTTATTSSSAAPTT